ncbi:MAG: glycine--tRNA ligase subunit beta [Halothiobacillaceae bacterium]
MTQRCDLLIEIGTEELPPKALRRLSEVFTDEVVHGLADAGLSPRGHRGYAAPRRLAVLVEDLATQTPERPQERRGPAVAAAFDDEGNPTRALAGFARSCGVSVEDLERMETDKGAWVVYRHVEPGQAAEAIIPDIVRQALHKLPIPKRMRWGAGSEEFVRPVHWAILLLGDQAIEADILGIRSGRETRGHRFHHPEPLHVEQPRDYAMLLETRGHVLADFAQRRDAIRVQVESLARELGGQAVIEDDLLEEVTALVEWPVAISGSFEAHFLDVPAEALMHTMQDNQKYFPVVDGQSALMPHFITVANIDSRDPEQVRRGNERVIRPRFADAEFFWKEDRKHPLEDHLEGLGSVVFQERLGSIRDKVERVTPLCEHIANRLGASPNLARRAATLAKCDLQTSMVGEFPELQGVAGRYLAGLQGEHADVARALDEQYLPRRAGDALPETAVGQSLALSDRLDTLVGIFAIGQGPTGARDPFALRRAALGVLRILIEKQLDLNLHDLLEEAAGTLAGRVPEAPGAVNVVFDFMTERLRAYYLDRGIRHDVFDAVAAVRPSAPWDFHRRVEAVDAFLALPQAEALAAANKRIHNILRKSGDDSGAFPTEVVDVNEGRLTDPAEQALYQRVKTLEAEVEPMFTAGDYTAALSRLAHLRDEVDAFFDQVMVMAEDPQTRANRVALLNRLARLFLRTADLSLIAGT